MRKFLWIAIIILLLAACQNGNNNTTTTNNGDGSTGIAVQQPEVPRIEDTPVPTATPIPTAQPLPDREHPGHVFPVSTRAIHVVAAGDTLSGLANKYEVTVKAFSDANRHYNFDLIEVGDALYVPACKIEE